MNRRKFIGISTTAAAAGAVALAADPVLNMDYSKSLAQPAGPYSIEIISPPEKAVRELPLFDTYKQAENFAQARMHLLRSNSPFWNPPGVSHEAGHIKVWSNNNQVVFECSWGETWTMAYSYVDVKGRLS